MKKTIFISILILAGIIKVFSFCGFYVAKSDLKLFNKTSQIILVHNGDHTSVTMSSDFQGDVKDFAMVIPVPVVLKKEDVQVVDRGLFDAFDVYSGPRLVEYYDPTPCYQDYGYYKNIPQATIDVTTTSKMSLSKDEDKTTVKIEAKYTVGEYDIMVLSAEQSTGLQTWLTENGYKIPAGAAEILEPYIKSNMKFFVCKVNLAEMKNAGVQLLRPLKISFNSPKFMLPIRLGMANGNGTQDMIVYAFTKNGRVETTNYRTVKMPTDNKVPEFVQSVFGKFYVDLYKKFRKEQGNNNVYLEYAWDLTNLGGAYYGGYHCDPCVGPSPMLLQMQEAGVDWITPDQYGNYAGSVFFTRLHVTYSEQDFPQDLMFEETPNKETYQARYVLNHCAQGDLSCDEGKKYKVNAEKRRWEELNNLASLTGWDVSIYKDYPSTLTGYVVPAPKMYYDNIKNQFVPDTTGLIKKEFDPLNIHQDDFNVLPVGSNGNDNNNNSGGGRNPYFIFSLVSMLILISLTVMNRMRKSAMKV